MIYADLPPTNGLTSRAQFSAEVVAAEEGAPTPGPLFIEPNPHQAANSVAELRVVYRRSEPVPNYSLHFGTSADGSLSLLLMDAPVVRLRRDFERPARGWLAANEVDAALATYVENDGTAVLEIMQPDRRLGIAVSPNSSESGWFAVFVDPSREPVDGELRELDLLEQLRETFLDRPG